MGRRGTALHQITQGVPMQVAQYVRMSTDHQRYSTENQCEAIEKYATERGMRVVETYADEGKSGLSLEGRDALKRLIADVQTKNPGFQAVLVYDISRWGRFQDADESAYYEYLCRRSGIKVFYCAEPFENDGSPMATIMKSVKRAMASEYSRELSTKVFQGQCRLIELGFRQGGAAGFGLRRQLVDERGGPKFPLSAGQHKSLQTDRVVLVPGPEEEISVVQYIYKAFVEHGRREHLIAEELNEMGIQTDRGRSWTRGTIHQVLTNEKYIGNNVYNRTSFKLKQRRVRNTPDMWVRCDRAFTAIIPLERFQRAREIIAARSRHMDDAVMLKLLRGLYERTGVLSGLLIDEQEGMPSSSMYQSRFGGLVRAYSLVGYRPLRDYHYLQINRALRVLLPQVIEEIIAGLKCTNAVVERDPGTGLLVVNDEFTVSVVIARCLQLASGTFRWRLRFETGLAPDITVVVRMAADQRTTLDYYLFPHIDLPLKTRLAEQDNEVTLDAYRFDSLDSFYALASRSPVAKIA